MKEIVLLDWRLNDRASATDQKETRRWEHLFRVLDGVEVELLTVAKIEAYKAKRLEEGAARKSVNNELCLLRRGLNLALEQELLQRAPKVKNLRVQNARAGFIDPPEYLRIVEFMERLEPVAADIVRFGYLLGWRRGEVVGRDGKPGLQWSEVNRETGSILLPASRTKNRTPKAIRVGAELRELLNRRWRDSYGSPCVFTRHGKPVKHFRKTWYLAVASIGRPELFYHDCRRSFARNALAAGLDIALAMAIGGWKTVSTFLRYAIQDERRMEWGVERVSAYIQGAAGSRPQVDLPPWLVTALRSLSEDERAQAIDIMRT